MAGTRDQESRTQTEQSTNANAEIPPKWEDINPTLIPLFEETETWFEDAIDHFYLAVGGAGRICKLSPEGVEFFRHHRCDPFTEHFETMVERFSENGTIENVRVVQDRDTAYERDEHSTWIRTESDDRFWIHEYVPFSQRATTPEQLEDELAEVMAQSPDFEDLFKASKEVATEMFNTDS